MMVYYVVVLQIDHIVGYTDLIALSVDLSDPYTLYLVSETTHV